MNNLSQAKQILSNGGYTCVLCCNDKVYSSTKRGVKPLLEFLEDENDYSCYSAADKVVGKAAAFLYVLIGIKEVYAEVISSHALNVFESRGIDVSYEIICESVINREKTGLCPMESAVMKMDDEVEALEAIKNKLIELETASRNYTKKVLT